MKASGWEDDAYARKKLRPPHPRTLPGTNVALFCFHGGAGKLCGGPSGPIGSSSVDGNAGRGARDRRCAAVAKETGRLALSDEKKGRRKASASGGSGKNNQARDVGGALRSAYQKVVDEQTPSDLLDLLKKLS